MSNKIIKKDTNKEIHQIFVNCIKKYQVVRKSTSQSQPFYGDVGGIAAWFYQLYPQLDKITITIYGGFHVTYPNPQHISVVISTDTLESEKLHMSIDKNGYWYQQPIAQDYSRQTPLMLNARGSDIKHKSKKHKSKKHKSKKHKSKKNIL